MVNNYIGYCNYFAGNATWGGDSYRLLQSLGGNKGCFKVPKSDGNGYYHPEVVYLFKSEEMYKEFKEKLQERRLDWFIELSKYHEIREGTVLIWEEEKIRLTNQ